MNEISYIILGIIILVGYSIFSDQINAYMNGFQTVLGDNALKIPSPKVGTQVYDLVITSSIRYESAYEDVLFLNENGGTISRSWQNPHKVTLSWLNFSWLDGLGDKSTLPTYELVIPAPNLFGATFKLSYILVDPDTGRQIKDPLWQNKEYKVPSGTEKMQITQKIVFKELVKKNYELWIIPDGGETHFNNHARGEAYKQVISG